MVGLNDNDLDLGGFDNNVNPDDDKFTSGEGRSLRQKSPSTPSTGAMGISHRFNRYVAGLITTRSMQTSTASTIMLTRRTISSPRGEQSSANVIGSKPNGWLTPISVSHQSEQMWVDRLSEVLQQFINELKRGLTAPTDMSTSPADATADSTLYRECH